MATLKDLLDSGMSPEEINALLSQLNVSTGGYDPNGTTGRGEPYMPPPEPQGRPGMVEQAPLNMIRNNSTGRTFSPMDRYGRPSQEQPRRDVWADGPQVLDSRQLPDGRTVQRVQVPARDGFGRQSVGIQERIVTPEYLNPAALAQQKFEAAKAELAYKQAQTAAAQQKPTEPEALRTIKGAMEIYKSLPDGDMKRAFGEKYGLEAKKVDEKPLPGLAVGKISEAGTSVENMTRSRDTFKDEYAGKTILGDLSNTVGRLLGDETGQAQWWQDFDVAQAQARHALFGSALTNTEKTAWEKISVSPRMAPEEIRKNLLRRQAIEERAASKLARAYAAGGYSQAQIKELLGTSAGVLDTPAPPVTNPSPTAIAPPKVGDFVDGYVFKGGNPADKASWMRK